MGEQHVKHYAADIFVDGLGLRNIAALMHLNGLTAEQEPTTLVARNTRILLPRNPSGQAFGFDQSLRR